MLCFDVGMMLMYMIDVCYVGDMIDGEICVCFYVDGVLQFYVKMFICFVVFGGYIEVVIIGFGFKWCYYVWVDGIEQQLLFDF